MYHHLKGTLIRNAGTQIVLETGGGIGWDLKVPLSTSQKAGKAGSEVILLTHLVVRENEMTLYGFLTDEERTLFVTLIGLSGVGPASALQVLSSMSPQDFALAVEKQDTTALKRIKGFGEKTVKRIILELKGKKTILPPSEESNAPSGMAGDAVAALVTMGIPQNEAIHRIEKVLAENPDSGLEDLIKLALKK